MPLKARSAPIDAWIRDMDDTGPEAYDTTLIRETISKHLRKMKM